MMQSFEIPYNGSTGTIKVRPWTAGERADIEAKTGIFGLANSNNLLVGYWTTGRNPDKVLQQTEKDRAVWNKLDIQLDVEQIRTCLVEAPFPISDEGIRKLDAPVYDQILQVVKAMNKDSLYKLDHAIVEADTLLSKHNIPPEVIMELETIFERAILGDALKKT